MDQFAACWGVLKDPRTGNAGLYDFHELLVIALCTALRRSGRCGHGTVREGEGALPARIPHARKGVVIVFGPPGAKASGAKQGTTVISAMTLKFSATS